MDSVAQIKKSEKKKRGPKPNPGQIVRLPNTLIEAADQWDSKQRQLFTRSESIRRLVELGLKKR